MIDFDGIKVFSATTSRDRDALGELITAWVRENHDLEIVDKQIEQTSDNSFHCFTITLFYRELE